MWRGDDHSGRSDGLPMLSSLLCDNLTKTNIESRGCPKIQTAFRGKTAVNTLYSMDMTTQGDARTNIARSRIPAQRRYEPRLWDLPPLVTNEHKINLLWQQVRASQSMDKNATEPSFARPTQASRRKAPNPPTPPDSAHSTQRASRPASPFQRPESSISARSIATKTSTVDSRRATHRAPRVTDRSFRDGTLLLHGIDVIEDPTWSDFRGPYRHFGTTPPEEHRKTKEEIVKWYHKQSGLNDSFIWLPLLQEDARNIAYEYQQMVAVEEEEAKFAFFGKLAFFQQDVAHVPRSNLRKRSAYCKMEWAPKPDGQVLHCPPIVKHVGRHAAEATSEPYFAFNNKPDCTFWLPMVQFNPVYRRAVPRLTFMVPKAEVVGPYLTIEFKKADQDATAAVNQLAAAAALILFNRLALRVRRLNEYLRSGNASYTPADFDGLKHYGVALAAQYVYIYEATPHLGEEMEVSDRGDGRLKAERIWQGCKLRLLVSLDLTREEEVLEMCSWVNEIQNWGLATHSEDLIVDIKGILRKGEGGDERISLLPHERRKLGLEIAI